MKNFSPKNTGATKGGWEGLPVFLEHPCLYVQTNLYNGRRIAWNAHEK
jgi:hypothetical protein